MKGKFRKILGNQGHHTCVMGSWRNFTKIYLIFFNKKFYSKNSYASQTIGDTASDAFCLFSGYCGHGMRLPRFTIISVDLQMTDRFTKCRLLVMADRQQSDFVVKIYKSLDNDFSCYPASSCLCIFPT